MVIQKPKFKGLFLNTAKTNGSIHELGKMCYDCLKVSSVFIIDYKEIDEHDREISLGYDFFIFNYHPVAMAWLDTEYIKKLPGFKSAIVSEVLLNNPFATYSPIDFDAFIVLDPTLQYPNEKVYAFPRPLAPVNNVLKYQEKDTPVIGTFGFVKHVEGIERIIEAVNKEFDKAIIKINIPEGNHVSKGSFDELNSVLKNYPTKSGVTVEINNSYFSKADLIDWYSQNTLNVFLQHKSIPDLSVATDLAIISGRPLAVSSNIIYRHIHPYIIPYPFQSLTDSITSSAGSVLKMQHDWAPENFVVKFEELLADYHVIAKEKLTGTLKLPSKDGNTGKRHSRFKKSDFIPPILYNVLKKLRSKLLGAKNEENRYGSYLTLTPFVHPCLLTFSQHNEDLLIDLLLGKKEKGVYVDVGANDPSYNSNTKRFYMRGWRGINIEPNLIAFNKINEARPHDLNLNFAISNKKEELTFYHLSKDTTLSTLDYNTAHKMAALHNLKITTSKVQTISLRELLMENMREKHIDFMSVDAEGHDLIVLKSNDWDKFRPTLVMIESNNEFESILSFMDSVNYFHIYSNLYNAIFIDKFTKESDLLNNITWNNN